MAKIIVGPVDPEVLEPAILPVVVVDPVRARLRETVAELIRHYIDDDDDLLGNGNRQAATMPTAVAREILTIEPFASGVEWSDIRRRIVQYSSFTSFQVGVKYCRAIIAAL